MKALSIRQPWIDAILSGRKQIEVRPWATSHRGRLLLHATAAFGIAEKEALMNLQAKGIPIAAPSADRLGAILGEAELIDCRPLRPGDWEAALMDPIEGRPLFAWELAQVREVKPEPTRGRRRLFEVLR